MGSKPSKAECPAPVEAKAVTIPRLPQEIIDEILDHLADSNSLGSLRACALTSKSWVQPCRRHLFRTVVFKSTYVDRWFKVFPVQEGSPAHHVRELRVWIGGGSRVPETFFEHTSHFTGADSLCFLGHAGPPSSLRPSLWKLPQSITSLNVNSGVVTLLQVRDIMAQLPNLENLSLTGFLVPVDRSELVGIGRVMRGRFGGQLVLGRGYADESITNMFLEIPSGLHFTEVQICYTREHLISAVRLTEACCKTLVKLSHSATFQCESHPLP